MLTCSTPSWKVIKYRNQRNMLALALAGSMLVLVFSSDESINHLVNIELCDMPLFNSCMLQDPDKFYWLTCG